MGKEAGHLRPEGMHMGLSGLFWGVCVCEHSMLTSDQEGHYFML